MKTETAFVGASVIDSFSFSINGTEEQALALKSTGIDCVAGYLGVINEERVKYILDSGMAFMPIALANDVFNWMRIIQECKKLDLPKECSVWTDLEGEKIYHLDPLTLKANLNVVGRKVKETGYLPSIYIGAPQPLDSQELYSLSFYRYWKGIGRTVDRYNDLAEPTCGWCITQMYHGIKNGMGMMWRDLDPCNTTQAEFKNTGVFVDANMIGADYLGRLPNWVIA